MAQRSMSTRVWSWFLLLTLGFLHVFGLHQGPGLFLRSKRANSFLLEEILPGNLERECLEEVCNYEEAREVFEDHQHTAAFWAKYYDEDQCESSPCGNGGNCTDLVGGFSCACPAPFFGETCELGPGSKPGLNLDIRLDLVAQRKDFAECPTHGPTSCEQLCTASEFSFTCSCLPGFKLQNDRRTCKPEVEFPCGQIPDQLQSNSSDSLCTNKYCPWQVSVLNKRGMELCKGALLGLRSILTSAHCLQSQLGPDLDPTQVFIHFNGQGKVFQVRSVELHERFSLAHDYDLAFLQISRPLRMSSALFHLCVPTHRDHAENVLMHGGKRLLVGGYGSSAGSVSLEDCRLKNVNHSMTNKMFCLETTIKPELRQDWIRDQNRDQTINRNRDQDRERPEQSRGVMTKKTKNETEGRQNGGRGVTQNVRPRILNERHQTAPDLGQTRTRTRDHQSPHPHKKEKESNKEKDNRGGAQNGHHQNQTEARMNNENRNTTQIGPDHDKQKVHPHQDHPRLNQDPQKPIQTGPNQDKQKFHSQQNPNDQDQDHQYFRGPNQDQLRGQPSGREVLQGTPVVSVDRGTVYLVGMVTSTAPKEGGTHILVLTKLSRHMTWLQQRLSHMTPQVTKFPQP